MSDLIFSAEFVLLNDIINLELNLFSSGDAKDKS